MYVIIGNVTNHNSSTTNNNHNNSNSNNKYNDNDNDDYDRPEHRHASADDGKCVAGVLKEDRRYLFRQKVLLSILSATKPLGCQRPSHLVVRDQALRASSVRLFPAQQVDGPPTLRCAIMC